MWFREFQDPASVKSRFSKKEKTCILKRSRKEGVAPVCSEVGIHPRTLAKWRIQLCPANQQRRSDEEKRLRFDRDERDRRLVAKLKKQRPKDTPVELVSRLVAKHKYPISRACLLMGVARRTWYRNRKREPISALNKEIAEKCRELVYATAKKYGLPPVFITAHVRHPVADSVRKEVMRTMIVDYGLSRKLVAGIFGRDLRRVRKSVLGV